jgi:1-acyl-sn-glycerol-3-phosphate acyltransferase
MAEPVYTAVIYAALGAMRAWRLRPEVRGGANVPRTGGAVVAINHVSYLDFVLAGVPCWAAGHRLVRFMAKESVFRHPVVGPLMRGMRHIPVDRSAGADAYARAVEALRAGELVGVFPEATISPSYCLETFKTGAVRMAAEAAVPVLPIVIWGSQRVLTKGRRREPWAARGTPISISVGEALPPARLGDPADGTRRLRARMYELLDDAQRTYPAYPADGSGTPPWWQPAHLGGGAPPPVTPREPEPPAGRLTPG